MRPFRLQHEKKPALARIPGGSRCYANPSGNSHRRNAAAEPEPQSCLNESEGDRRKRAPTQNPLCGLEHHLNFLRGHIADDFAVRYGRAIH